MCWKDVFYWHWRGADFGTLRGSPLSKHFFVIMTENCTWSSITIFVLETKSFKIQVVKLQGLHACKKNYFYTQLTKVWIVQRSFWLKSNKERFTWNWPEQKCWSRRQEPAHCKHTVEGWLDHTHGSILQHVDLKRTEHSKKHHFNFSIGRKCKHLEINTKFQLCF